MVCVEATALPFAELHLTGLELGPGGGFLLTAGGSHVSLVWGVTLCCAAKPLPGRSMAAPAPRAT